MSDPASSKKKKPFRSGFIVLVGKPNTGKSTLLNCLVGQKVAIISSHPQTTRQRVIGVRNGPGFQIVLVDTPGFYEPKHALGRLMRKSAQEETEGADLILFMADASFPPGKEDLAVAEHLFVKEAAGTKSVFLVLNKMDLISDAVLQQRVEQYSAIGKFQKVFSISCVSGKNIGGLFEKLVATLSEGPAYYPEDTFTDQDERTMIREIIREKILQVTRQEVPHSVAVEVEEMRPAAGKELTYIRAEAFVEKDSQKGIIVGAGGKRLKLISTNARKDIEKLLGEKVFLDLWVKVKPDWRDREDVLRAWGYE